MNDARSGSGPTPPPLGQSGGHGIPSPVRPPGQPAPPSHLHNMIPAGLQRKPVADEEPLELEVEEAPMAAPVAPAIHSGQPAQPLQAPQPAKSKIHGVSSASGPAAAQNWTRGTHKNQTGAVRMRAFHCRLSEQGLEYMEHAINDWLDRHPDIEVKSTNSAIGQFDGKIKEPALIVTVWY